MTDRLRVLMVEDDENDALLTYRALVRGGFAPEWLRVESADSMAQALDEREWDVVISDYAMPSFDGLRAYALFSERRVDIPFIFVSGALGEERAVEAMRAGAHDYLLKGHLGRLAVAIRREMRASSSRRQQRHAEDSARRSQRRLGMAVEVSGAGVFEARIPPDDDTFIADRCIGLLGAQPHDLPEPASLFDWVRERVHPDDRQDFERACGAFTEGDSGELAAELRMRHRLGHWLDVDVRAKAFGYDAAGRVSHFVGVALDLTERKRMEGNLRQKHKMEAIGRLAGGIAHDFNNVLTAITAFSAFALESLEPDHPARADVEEVLAAGGRAAALTTQLLAFSRLKKGSPRDVLVGEVVESLKKMLERLLGADIAIETRLGPAGLSVRIDPAELEQVLLNLTVNARDAMPKGGSLTIALEQVRIEDGVEVPSGRLIGPEAASGAYVLISVTDSGTGMDAATLARIFDPFFTTKDLGRGTGLGLATCYGIVRQAGGVIAVESEPGVGSTFNVYLPRGVGEATRTRPSLRPLPLDGSGTVLIVEDDESVRALVVRTLERHGYRVLSAPNGDDAIALAAAEPGPIALLLTDVVMKGLSGGEVADALRKARPEMRVLFMSGYSPSTYQRGALAPGAAVIQKPFTPDTLAQEVRAVLAQDVAPST